MKKVAVLLSLAVVCGPVFAADGMSASGQLMQTAGVSEMPKITPIADVTAGPVQVTDKTVCKIEGSVKETVYGLGPVRMVKKTEGSGTLSCVGHQHPYTMAVSGAGFAPGLSLDLLLAFFRGSASSESASGTWSAQLALPIGVNPAVLGGTWKAQGSFDIGGYSFAVYVPSSITAPGAQLNVPTFPRLDIGATISALEVKVSQ